MTQRTGALKTTILGGAIFMIPFVILLAIAGKAYVLMQNIATPITNAIGVERVGVVAVIDIVSVLAMVAVCYGAGLLATSARGRRAYQRMDDKLLDLIPRYGFIKSMASGLHKETTTAMTVVLVRFDDQSQIGFEVERNEDWVVVFLPGSPDPWSGAVSYVTADRVTPLPVDFNRAVRAMRMAGRDSLSLLEAGPRGDGARPPSPT